MSPKRLHIFLRPGTAMRRRLLVRHERMLQSDLRSQTSSAWGPRRQSPSRPSRRVDSLGNCGRSTFSATSFDVARRSTRHFAAGSGIRAATQRKRGPMTHKQRMSPQTKDSSHEAALWFGGSHGGWVQSGCKPNDGDGRSKALQEQQSLRERWRKGPKRQI